MTRPRPFRRTLAKAGLALALALGFGPAAAPPAFAQGPNDTIAQKEKEPEDPGSPVFTYIFVGLMTLGILATVCKSSRRTP
jgi:hypothetical protein